MPINQVHRGLTKALADFATSTTGAAIPGTAYTIGRFALIDTVGVMLAGGDTNTYATLARTVSTETGSGGATILPTAQRATPRVAALLNATAGHALDYDDATYASYGHPSTVLIPPLLAVGEAIAARGPDLGAAYAVGLSCIYALADGVDVHAHYGRGWHATGTLGVVGATAAVCRLLHATPDQTRQALAIAGSLASGSRRNFGTMTKPLHAGVAASNAVFAASLAIRGFTADLDMLEQPGGYLDLFGHDDADADRAMHSIDSDPWHFLDDPPHLKLYPCCFNTHRAIDAVLELISADAIDARDVVEVRVRVEPRGLTPLRCRLPTTGLEAKFSMEYVVSTALIDGAVTLDAFTDEAINRTDVRLLMERIVASEANVAGTVQHPYADVEMDLRDGTTRAAHMELTPQQRLSTTREQVSAKFRDCVAHSNRVWDCNALEQQLWSMVDAGVIRLHTALTSRPDG